MNEEIEKYMKTTLKLIEAWEDEKTMKTAKDLSLSLSIMKLIIGSSEFDGLPSFSRYMNETSSYILKQEGNK